MRLKTEDMPTAGCAFRPRGCLASCSGGLIWYRIPDASEIRVNRANLTRFTLREPLWVAWCDSIRVLIRVLGVGTAHDQRCPR